MATTGDLQHDHLRIARPTNDLLAVVRFYRDGLGFEVLVEFKDHDGIDGVMLLHVWIYLAGELTRPAKPKAGRRYDRATH